MDLSGLTRDYVETWPHRRRGEKVSKTALWPAQALRGGDLKPVTGVEGPNLPTDLKHAPHAQTGRRSWTPIVPRPTAPG
jgi:hypothetical protein